MVASTCATAGTTLVAMAMSTTAWADYTSSQGYIYHPGLALQATAGVTVTAPSFADTDEGLYLDGVNGYSTFGTNIASYVGRVATGPVPLFADEGAVSGGVTDCAGESITGGTGTFAGCYLKTLDFNFAHPGLVDSVLVTVAFPNVIESASLTSGLSNGTSDVVTSNAQGDPRFAATDSVVVEECGPMPTGFNIKYCIGLGTMTGTSGNYTATVPAQDPVGSTTCAGHSGSTSQCSLWTVEVHNDSTGKYWWPLANGIPISFK